MIFGAKTRQAGFTLTELMIVIAIIGILAAVGIPALIDYLHASKASEASTALQAIKEKQEAYMGEYKHYTNNLAWYPAECGDCTDESRHWNLDPGDQAQVRWIQLGFTPGGPTYYSYMVETAYGDAGIQPVNPPPDLYGVNWSGNAAWFVAYACGDIDCDNIRVTHYLTSDSSVLVKTAPNMDPADAESEY